MASVTSHPKNAESIQRISSALRRGCHPAHSSETNLNEVALTTPLAGLGRKVFGARRRNNSQHCFVDCFCATIALDPTFFHTNFDIRVQEVKRSFYGSGFRKQFTNRKHVRLHLYLIVSGGCLDLSLHHQRHARAFFFGRFQKTKCELSFATRYLLPD